MTAAPDIRQVLVHPSVWPYLELWLAAHGLVLGRVPVEDDLPTYAMTPADPGDAEKVLAAGIRDAARQTTGQTDTDCPACEAGIEHIEHCPTPETHNWGCGCPTDELPAPAVGQPAEAQPADEALTAAERQFLKFALDLAFDRMVSDSGFTDEDDAALARLRRMAEEARS